MGRYLALLRRYIDELGLVNRDATVARIRDMIDQGLISEDQANGIYRGLQSLGKEVQRRRNYLNRAPELDEIYPDGMPDLVIGRLLESPDPDVPAGFFLQDNLNIVFAGPAGSGKSTAIYNLALAIADYNKRHPDDFISMIIWETKDGALIAIAEVIPDCLVVSTHATLRIGLQSPKHVQWSIWNNALGYIISRRGGLKAGGITITEMLNFLVRAMNTPPSDQGLLYPSFENLYELSNMAPKGLFESKEQYQLSVNQVLRQFAQGTGDLFKAFRGLDLEDIVAQKKHLIIDARGLLPDWVRAATSDILLKRLLLGREFSNNPSLCQCMILWDEADTDVSRRAEEQYI